ncbi:hypothetical protein BGZ73_003619 [Actinomortierella ambigua]|nr:hypothetical protein BGZ73_003619 [Actinomortierella ambigua]
MLQDLLELTPESNPDHAAIQEALEKHKQGLSKIDDQKWIQEHNEMLRDLQQRIKGLPQQQPSLLKYHHQHRQPQPSQASPPSSHSPTGSLSSTSSESKQSGNSSSTKSKPSANSPPSTATSTTSALPSVPWFLSFAKSAFGGGRTYKSGPSSSGQLSTSAPSSVSPISSSSLTTCRSDTSAKSDSGSSDTEGSTLSSHDHSRHWKRFLDPPTPGYPLIPASIRQADAESEYHVFVFTDIVLWTKRVTNRYQRKDGTSWTFKLVEPVSRLTQVDSTDDGKSAIKLSENL